MAQLPLLTNVTSFEHLQLLHLWVATLLQSELKKSTCPERKVSAAIVGFNLYGFDLLSVTTNGAPADSHNLSLNLHKRLCLHAEEKALKALPKRSSEYLLASYSSLAPCYNCSKQLLSAGICAHVYISEYDDIAGVQLLLNKGIPVYKLVGFGRLVPLHPDVRLGSTLLYEAHD